MRNTLKISEMKIWPKNPICEYGFSLLEISFVLIISSLFYMAIFKLYDYQSQVSRIEKTEMNLDEVHSQVSFFQINERRYPCPANRAIGPEDANYGREFDANCDPAAIGLTLGNCVGGVCLVAGARDFDGSGVTGDIADERVLIGAFPVRSMPAITGSDVPDSIALDGWGSKLTYAVTLSQTQGNYRFFMGMIRALDEFGQPTAGIDNDAHYVIVSHGPDRKGAFIEGGTLFQVCGAVTTDDENCDDDSTFVQALGHSEAQGAPVIPATGRTPYYDDYVFFSRNQSANIWTRTAAAPFYVFNENTNNVGVGTNNPQQRVHVDGNLNVSGHAANEWDNPVLVSRICDETGVFCFNVTDITGPNGTTPIACTLAGQVMRGISNTNEDCIAPIFDAPEANRDCSPGWVAGIRTNGTIICTP